MFVFLVVLQRLAFHTCRDRSYVEVVFQVSQFRSTLSRPFSSFLLVSS